MRAVPTFKLKYASDLAKKNKRPCFFGDYRAGAREDGQKREKFKYDRQISIRAKLGSAKTFCAKDNNLSEFASRSK